MTTSVAPMRPFIAASPTQTDIIVVQTDGDKSYSSRVVLQRVREYCGLYNISAVYYMICICRLEIFRPDVASVRRIVS